jgi:hypothetical protein
MKIKPSISIKSKISNVKVVIKLDFVYVSKDESGIEKRKSISKQEFDYNRSFRLSIPLHINYDGYLYDHVNTINVILVRAINDIIGDAKEKAKNQMIDIFDMAEVYIKDIYADKESEKDEDERIAEWRVK